ncbi:MAG: serine hydrolase [Myxococcales bacterium]|nr:serine hydrolase [Myxococcales bacterium]MDD9964723.1 serine hydrolase [Myxococcales bacterium]
MVGSATSPEVLKIPAQRVAALRERLQQTVDDGYFAGHTVCAVHRGEPLIDEAFGYRDIEERTPMTTDTIFRIASSTKPIIAVGMMLLHEEGAWDFEDRVDHFIPEFSRLQVRTKDGSLVDPMQPMRMRHLMSHAAGFGGTGVLDRRREGDGDGNRGLWFDRLFRGDLQGLVNRLSDKPLAFHPGKRFLYGPCCDVQGYLIEKLTGKTLDVFLNERIFEPLGMGDTGFWVEPGKTERTASLYAYSGGKLERIDKPSPERITRRPSFLSGGGGLWSTPDDYRRFCQMLRSEGAHPSGRLLQADTVRKMRQDLLEPQVYVKVVGDYIMPGARFGTNVSVITEPQGDSAMYGKNSYSWGGAFGTWFWIDPTNDLYASGMVQIRDGGAQHLGMKVEYPDLKQLTAQMLYWGEERLG